MMTQERFVKILDGLPTVHLDLLGIIPKLIGETGNIDPQKVGFHYKELETAINQAEAYAQSTREIVKCLQGLGQ